MNLFTIRNVLTSGKTIYDLPLRVTFYARVSTDREEQLNSLENQVMYFENFIKQQTNWIFVDGYVDEGISGTSVKKRENFLRMIDDAKRGIFNLILTKEISRFSRNTVDSIQFTQQLLSFGVGVQFLSDNICTFDPDSELRLTIMSSIAQDEIRKLSERIRFGYKRSIEKGVVPGNDNFYGYVKDNGKLKIEEEGAKIVRLIFIEYSKGKMGTSKLGHYLFEKYNIRSKTGKPLAGTVIARIIRNPKYKGYYCAHRETTVDYHSPKRIRFKPKDWIVYKDNETCPPIVSEELWEKCNEILEKNSKNYECKTPTNSKYALSGKIKCFHDGATFVKGGYKNKRTGVETKYWGCSNYRKYGKMKTEGCKTPILRYDELLSIFKKMLKSIIDNDDSILSEIFKLVGECTNKNDYTKEIAQLEEKINKILKAKNELIKMRALQEIDGEEYNFARESYNQEIEKLEQEKENYLIKEKSNNSMTNLKDFEEKVNKVIFEDDESVFGTVASIIDNILVERIETNDETKQKIMLHIKLNVMGYQESSFNLKDFSLLFSNNERCSCRTCRSNCWYRRKLC